MTVSPPPSAPSVLPPHLVPVSLTHVVYDPQDPYGGPLVGKFLAYCSLVPIALLVSYATLILFRRDLATLFMFTGQLVNETVNAVLKKWVKQDRPYPGGCDGRLGLLCMGSLVKLGGSF